jgi:hypothetical protein
MKVNDKKNTSVNPIGLDSVYSCERYFGWMSGTVADQRIHDVGVPMPNLARIDNQLQRLNQISNVALRALIGR